MRLPVFVLFLLTVCVRAEIGLAAAADSDDSRVPAGAHVYIAPMNGFETYLAAAILSEKVPLVVVGDRSKADYEIAGNTGSRKPGLARALLLQESGTDEQASIPVTHIKTRTIAFAYSVHRTNDFDGKKGVAEECAKKLKAHINGK